MSANLYSMTGFGSAEGSLGGQTYRIEIKTLNHRFLDIKLKLPKELQSVELSVRSLIQSRFTRGTLELKVDRLGQTQQESNIQINFALAEQYAEALKKLSQKLKLDSTVHVRDVANYSDVLTQASFESNTEETWKFLEPLLGKAFEQLKLMRLHEGKNLSGVLEQSIQDLKKSITVLRKKREKTLSLYKEKIKTKIKTVFDAYPISELGNTQTLLESRISQELAMLVDRTDIEEELTRFEGHLGHFTKTLSEGGTVGRKLDFILQELSREINTLGNKAQDFGTSEEVVGVKVKLEQLREQVMNLE